MNWRKPPLYPTPVPIRVGASSYSESSPPEEINDDVLPVNPMPIPVDQPLGGALLQKKQQDKPKVVRQQTNKMSQPKPSQAQHFAHQANAKRCSAPSQFINPHAVIPPSNIIPSTALQNVHQIVVGTGGGGGAKVGTIITADRRFGFASPTLEEQRARVQEILHALNTYTLSQCHDKVRWFATVVLQQLLDLELYTACSTAVEQCSHGQLKRMKRRQVLLSNDKKKFEQEKKQLISQRVQLTKEKAELTKCKEQLEQQVKTLTPLETKCQAMKQSEDKLKADKQQLTKELEQMRQRNEQLEGKVKQTEQERDAYKRRADDQETVTKRRVKQLEDELAAEKGKRTAAAAATTTAAMDESKFRELEQKLKSKKAEVKQLRAELADRPKQQEQQQQQRCAADLEEQLRASNENADKHRHRAMKLDERLRRKTAKLEEQKALFDEAISAKQKAEYELSRLKQENGTLRQQINANMASPLPPRTVNAGAMSTAASANFELLNDRIRGVTRKRKELSRALALLGVNHQQKRPKHATTATTSVQQEEEEQQQQIAEVPLPLSTTATTSSSTNTADTDTTATTTTTTTTIVTAATVADGRCSVSADGVTCATDGATTEAAAASSASTDTTVVEAQQQQQSPQLQPEQQQLLPPPPPLHHSPAVPTKFDNDAIDETQQPEQQQQQSRRPPTPSPPASPSTSSCTISAAEQQPQQQLTGEQIVASFLQFIRQRPADRGERSLVTDYLQQSFVPIRFHPLIAEQLLRIAAKYRDENGKQKKRSLTDQ